jgi:hypothetical protein
MNSVADVSCAESNLQLQIPTPIVGTTPCWRFSLGDRPSAGSGSTGWATPWHAERAQRSYASSRCVSRVR